MVNGKRRAPGCKEQETRVSETHLPPQPVTTPSRFVSIEQLATELDVAKATIRKWISAGLLPPPLRLPGGRLYRWRRQILEQFLDDLQDANQPQRGTHHD